VSAFVRPLLPGVKIVEANHASELVGSIDVWVPQPNFLHDNYNFYFQRQQAGEEIWFYTCPAPQGNYANRFIELPLIQTRLLHWLNFRYNIPGYLHWGLNWWNNNPFGETTGIITESGNILPGGDAWIVYPGTKGDALPSTALLPCGMASLIMKCSKCWKKNNRNVPVKSPGKWCTGLTSTIVILRLSGPGEGIS
jgi:hypothetical protein